MGLPYITVLTALKREVAAGTNGHTINGKSVTPRHTRHRPTRSDERPCVDVEFVSNDLAPQQEQTAGDGTPELVMALSVNIGIEMELQPEADDPASDAGDPTGFGDCAIVMGWVLDRLLPDLESGADPNTLEGTAWEIQYQGSASDETEASPDIARIRERLVILYRVRADHPTTLLMES